MADRNLYRYGAAAPVQLPRSTGFAVARGDLSWWDTTVLSDVRPDAPAGSQGVVKSAASFAWQGSLSATQAAFVALFAGVNAQRWPVTGNVPPIFGGQDGYLRVDTGGVFEFDASPGVTFQPLAYVGPDQLAGGTALLPQQVNVVADLAHAIGIVEKYSAGPTVYVRLLKSLFKFE